MTQKQRSLALLGGVLVVAGALGLYAWFGVFQTGKAKDEAKSVSDTLFSFKKEQVKKLVVSSHGQVVEANLTDTGWDIVSPVKTAGDRLAFDTITEKLAGLKQKRDIGEQSALTQYGLAAPKVSVTATLDDGTTHELQIGADNSYDGTVFARVGDSKRVSILEASVKFPLDKGLFELRDKRVFAFEDSQLKHLDVAVSGFAYGLDHTPDNKWKLTAPVAMDADAQRAGQILTALKNLRATRFASDQASQADLTRYALDKPTITVQLTLDKDQQETLTFSEQKEGTAEHTYVKVASQPFIAEVGPQIEKDLMASLSDLRDKTILSFDTAAVKGFQFQAGTEKFEVRKTGGGGDAGPEAWTLAGGASGAGKKWKLSALASALHDLKGTSIVSENADAKALAAAGLDQPAKEVTVLGDGDSVLGKLLVGKTEAAKINVKAAGSNRIYLIDAFKVSNLPATPADVAETPPTPPAGAGSPAPATP